MSGRFFLLGALFGVAAGLAIAGTSSRMRKSVEPAASVSAAVQAAFLPSARSRAPVVAVWGSGDSGPTVVPYGAGQDGPLKVPNAGCGGGPKSVPGSWQPRDFNGSVYYIIPLGQRG
jgi:hypothetical protein